MTITGSGLLVVMSFLVKLNFCLLCGVYKTLDHIQRIHKRKFTLLSTAETSESKFFKCAMRFVNEFNSRKSCDVYAGQIKDYQNNSNILLTLYDNF